MASTITISQVNRLGRRIRDADPIDEADLRLLQRLLQDHAAVLAEVQQDLIDRIGRITPASRLKTVATIVDKLRRERNMSLSRMRDIAGIRIVEEMDRQQQDVLVKEILEAVGPGTVIDRRAKPSYGYRAVHVIVERGGRYVEVQVRTTLQNTWAQIVERLGDSWGRQIRYGEPPEDAYRTVLDSRVTRGDLWALVHRLSEMVDLAEVLAIGGYDLPEDQVVSMDQVGEMLRQVARLTDDIDSL